jgi:hypothetical protein
MEKTLLEQLQEPFYESDIEWRVGNVKEDANPPKGLAMAYITNRAIQSRLDDVCGVFGWRNEFREWGQDGQLCGLSIWDSDKNVWITKWDGADDTNFESTKGGLSQAMKRAAYQWGIGRYLYNLPAQWVEVEKRGKNWSIVKDPKIPMWALPDTKAEYICEKCQNKLVEGDGKTIPQIVAGSKKAFDGRVLCLDCIKTEWAAKRAAQKKAAGKTPYNLGDESGTPFGGENK